jgi:hypothetical protein
MRKARIWQAFLIKERKQECVAGVRGFELALQHIRTMDDEGLPKEAAPAACAMVPLVSEVPAGATGGGSCRPRFLHSGERNQTLATPG